MKKRRPLKEPLVLTCSTGVREGWTVEELYRLIISGIPREFRSEPEYARQRLLVEPPLTNTPWDVLLAGVVEHVTTLHGYDAPKWTDHPERFWRQPRGMDGLLSPTIPEFAFDALACGPAAFLRHGILQDPRNLDRRGGELVAWTTEAEIDQGSAERPPTEITAHEYAPTDEHGGWLRVESAMRRRKLRAHVYLVGDGTVLKLAATTKKTGTSDRILGPRRIEAALGEVENGCGWKPDWKRIHDRAKQGTHTARTRWNSPHLVVTGASPAHALIMAAPRASEHDPATIRDLATAAGNPTASDVIEWFERATATPVPPNAGDTLRRVLDPHEVRA